MYTMPFLKYTNVIKFYFNQFCRYRFSFDGGVGSNVPYNDCPVTTTGMNNHTGIFTCQEKGTWYFSFTGVVGLKKADNYGLEIAKNNKVQLSETYARDYGQKITNKTLLVSVATSVVAELQGGDTISVRVKYKGGASFLSGADGTTFVCIKL